jgi:succinoglycan biosynthesis protein ExoW
VSRIGVVVPFYQRNPGLLALTMRSIVEQRTASELDIVVVDDDSPTPAEPELAGLPEFRGEIRLIRQANAGPGAARNTALDALCGKVDHMSFLDSDDVWNAGHLDRAERAMAAGADFYFADYQRANLAQTEFQRHGLAGQYTQQLRGQPDIIEHTGDPIDTLLRYHVGTGTVVYDYRKFPTVRFPREYRNAHEDTLFWLTLAAGAQRVMLSEQCVMQCGVGVNIYTSTGWESTGALCKLRDEYAFCRQVMTEYPLSALQRAHMTKQLKGVRSVAAASLLYQARRGFPGRTCVRRYLAEDPAILGRIPLTLARVLWRRSISE